MKRLTDVWRVVKWLLLAIALFALLLLLAAIEGTPTWELLDLLIIPAVLAVGAWWLNKMQREAEREEAEKNREEEREIARERREQEILESYFDRMTELLVSENLRERSLNEKEPEVQTIARVRTLAVLRNLGSERKGHVIKFLYEAGLLKENEPIVSLEGANLVEASLVGAHLQGVSFYRAFMAMANLESANLTGAKLQLAQLPEAILKLATLEGANLHHSVLRGANLWEANLREASLKGADVRGANLWEANLREASLKEANLQSANLHSANLSEANLFRATLTGVNLLRANLKGTCLQEAHLIGVNLQLAYYDTNTRWPIGFDPKAAGAILVDEEGNPVEEANE